MDILSAVYLHAVAFSALAVVVIQQVLKLKLIPLKFANKYPVPTVILLSLGASVLVVIKTVVQPQSWIDWAVLVGTIAVTAALTYNTTLKHWTELRDLESQV